VKYWEIVADNLSKAGMELRLRSAIDSNGRTIWIVDVHHGDGKRFVVHADEKLNVFAELESAIHACGELPRQAGEICPKLPDNSPARNGTQFDSLVRTAKREDVQGTTSIAAAIYVVSSFGNASCRRINSSPSRFRSSRLYTPFLVSATYSHFTANSCLICSSSFASRSIQS
jgi:hypothetical protein